eukprot:m.19860 g.19860  ORF g.19860 m.19860 type:complete len:2367 (+) comp7678_c0_seq1:44-7144(+)
MAASANPSRPGDASGGRELFSGYMIKSPPNADPHDPEKSTGFHSWRRRFFRLMAGGPQILRYYETESSPEEKGNFAIFPGTAVEKHSSPSHRFMLKLNLPASFGKEKKEARVVWLDCEKNKERDDKNQDDWFFHLSRSCMWQVSNARLLHLTAQFFSTNLAPLNVTLEASEGGGSMVMTTIPNPGEVAVTSRVPIFGRAAFHGAEPSQSWLSLGCPKKVKAGLFHGPAGATEMLDVEGAMRIMIQSGDGGESVQLVSHCPTMAELMCLTINACDLSNPHMGIHAIMDLLEYSVSLRFGQCSHPEFNIQVLTPIFRGWALSALQGRPDIAAALCTPRPDGSESSFIKLIKSLNNPKTSLCDLASGFFVIDVIDILIQHARSTQIDREHAAVIQAHVETAIVPTIAELVARAAQAPVLVRGVLQDAGPDWTTPDLLAIKNEDIPKALTEDLARLNKLYGGNPAQHLPKLPAPPPFDVDRKKMLLAHVDVREPRILQRLLYLLLTLTNEESSYTWLLRQPAALTQLATAMQNLAQYRLIDDPLLSPNPQLREMRVPHVLRTLGAVVPTLLVFFDNIAAFFSDPDRAPPDDASVQLWMSTIQPALVVVLQSTATIEATSILLQFCDPARLSSTLPKPAELATMRKDICSAIYPLRRRGGYLWGTDKGSNFSVAADLAYLCFDYAHHSLTKLVKRIPAVNTDLARHLYEWYCAHYPENTDPRTFPIANGRVLVLNTRLETLALEPHDITIEMSPGGGTLLLLEVDGKKSLRRVPLFGSSSSHSSEPDQSWLSLNCPSKEENPRWLGVSAQSTMIVRNENRLIVRRPIGEPLHLVAHCVLHAKLLTKILNSCDLYDATISARRVLDLLVFSSSKEFGACDHPEHNSQLNIKALRTWLLFTIERQIDVAAALCSPGPGDATICDLISVLGLPKSLYREQEFGMFVTELLETLIRFGRDRRLDAAKTAPIARYVEQFVVPALAAVLVGAAEKPAFVRGVLQDSGADWNTENLFDGRDIVETINTDAANARKIMNAARSLPGLSEVTSFTEQRRKLMGVEGRHRLVTAHTQDSANPLILVRLAYLLLSISSDELSVPWLYRQPKTLKSLARVLESLATYVLNNDPHLTHNIALRNLRATHVLRTFGPIVPTLFVFFDNLAFVPDGTVPDKANVQLWETELFPHIREALSATTTTETSSVIWQFLPSMTGKAYFGLELSGVSTEIASVLLSLRRRGDVMCNESYSGKDKPAFEKRADVCLLAYDHLYHIIRRLSEYSPILRNAAVTHLMALLDAVLTRVDKTEKDPIGNLALISEPRFSHLDIIFQSVVAQFPDSHSAILTGEGGSRLSHTLEMLSFHFRDLESSSTALDGVFSIVLFFLGLAELVPKHGTPAASVLVTAALQQCVLPHIIKLGVECFSADQVFLLHFLCSDPNLVIRKHVVMHTTIAKSVFAVLGNLLKLPDVASLACENYAESFRRMLQAMTAINELDDLAQVPLAVAVCDALASLGGVVAIERASETGTRRVQAAVAGSLLPEATRVLEQLCSCDSIIVFALSRLLCEWLQDESAALALTRIPPTEGYLKIVRHLGDESKVALRYQDRWILRILNHLLKHSSNYAIADFLCASVAYELMVTIHTSVRAVGSSDGWPSLVLAVDVTRRIIGHGSKAASVVCDRLEDALSMLIRTLRSLVATTDEVAKKRIESVSVKSGDAVFIASLIAALATHVSADPVIARTFRGCEEIESVLVVALETNVEDIAMRRYILHALASLVLFNRGHAEQICNVNNRTGVRVICKMLRHADRNIHSHAAVVLSQLVMYVPSCIPEVRDCGGYTDLIDKLAAGDQTDLSRLSLVRLLARLTEKDDKAAEDLLDRDIVQMLVGFLGRFQGQSTNVRYTMYYEIGILRVLMNMASHASVRTRLLDTPLLATLRKIQDELPANLKSLEAIHDQLGLAGNEEDGMEAFLTNPRVLSELSEMMKKKLDQTEMGSRDDQKKRVGQGQRNDRRLGKDQMDKLGAQFSAMLKRINDMPKTARGLDIAIKAVVELLEDQLSSESSAEMYSEPISLTLSPEEQRRFALGQARSINQLVALLTHLPNAMKPVTEKSRGLRLMISYNWGVKSIAIKVAEQLRQLKDTVESVWIDVDNMHMAASIYDGMADAIQTSDAIVVLPSSLYEKSPNCNLEIKYCADLRKKIFHVKAEKNYTPRGTVGLILGGSLWVDLSDNFDKNYPQLVAQVEGYHFTRANPGAAPPALAAAANATAPSTAAIAAAAVAAAAEAPPNYVEAIGARPTGGAAAAAMPMPMPAAAAASGAEGGLRPDSIKKLMVLLDLEDYLPKFQEVGIKSITDVVLWTQDELESIGMKKGEAKRLLSNAAMYK